LIGPERVLLWSYLLFSVWAGLSFLRRRHVFGARFLVSILLVAALSAAGIWWPAYRREAFIAATAGFVLFLFLPGVLVGVARRAAGTGRFGTARRLLSATLLLAPSTFLGNERDLYRAAAAREELAREIASRIRARQGNEHSRTGLAIAAVVTVVHVIASVVGDTQSPLTLLTLGANHLPLVREGEWYRVVTAMFLHAGTLHLVLNASAIWIVGRWVEPKLGASRTFLIFVIGGIVGNLVSLFASAQVAVAVPSVGASGGALALLGAVIPLTLRDPAGAERSLRLRTTAVVVGATFFLGFVEPAIDDGAHLGGLLAGAVLGILFSRRPMSARTVRVLAAMVLSGVGIAAALAVENAVRWSRPVELRTDEFTLRSRTGEAARRLASLATSHRRGAYQGAFPPGGPRDSSGIHADRRADGMGGVPWHAHARDRARVGVRLPPCRRRDRPDGTSRFPSHRRGSAASGPVRDACRSVISLSVE